MDDRDIRWQAVERAYREHADDVYKVALAILRDPDAAVDVTHDTFARAFDRWHQYDANRPLRAWLHGIVSHAALDALRRRRVRAVAAPTIGRIREAHGSGSFEGDPAPRIADQELVADAMAGLKPDARAALVLRHAYGYDYAEIARFLRTSPGNVGSILSRAHAALRLRLDATANDPSASEPATELPATGHAARPPR
jgi:RNA polymerase sigma-70 factor (ECF subfamily)